MIFLSAIKKLKENKSNDEVFEFIKAAYPEIENSKTQLLLAIDSIKKSNYYLNIFNSNTSKKLYNTIEELIEPHNLQFISPVYQCEKALDAYYSVKYTHQQGQIYKNLIDNMYYLNDDFNDELYHFSVALERYLLNIGYINEQINMLEARTKNSGIYDHDNYLRDILTN
jgi:archaellum component FlaC